MPPQCQLLRPRSLQLPVRALRTVPTLSRTFATTQPLAGAKGGDLGSHLPKHVIPKNAPVPEYPHGASRLFKQADKGLYGGQMVQFGNNVSHRTKTKTRRMWKPNVVNKSFYSILLKKRIKLRVTTNVIKTMEREGGLDEYLLKDKDTRVKELGPTGWALRWLLMQTPEVIQRNRAQAEALGLTQEVIDERWPLVPAWKQAVKEALESQIQETTAAENSAQESNQKSGDYIASSLWNKERKFKAAWRLNEEKGEEIRSRSTSIQGFFLQDADYLLDPKARAEALATRQAEALLKFETKRRKLGLGSDEPMGPADVRNIMQTWRDATPEEREEALGAEALATEQAETIVRLEEKKRKVVYGSEPLSAAEKRTVMQEWGNATLEQREEQIQKSKEEIKQHRQAARAERLGLKTEPLLST